MEEQGQALHPKILPGARQHAAVEPAAVRRPVWGWSGSRQPHHPPGCVFPAASVSSSCRKQQQTLAKRHSKIRRPKLPSSLSSSNLQARGSFRAFPEQQGPTHTRLRQHKAILTRHFLPLSRHSGRQPRWCLCVHCPRRPVPARPIFQDFLGGHQEGTRDKPC